MRVFAGLLAASVMAHLPLAGADARTVAVAPPGAWEIGPVIAGRNYSLGPSRPLQFQDGWGFYIGPASEPHYVTFRHGSLRGKTHIRMRFRVDGPKGAVIHGAKCGAGSPSAVTLHFQRAGDDWGTDGGRWWATFASVGLRGPMAETEIVAPLNGNWTSVSTMSARSDPRAFAAAKDNADRVGFTFANCEGYGHGARATAPVRFIVTKFEVV